MCVYILYLCTVECDLFSGKNSVTEQTLTLVIYLCVLMIRDIISDI